MNELKLTRKEIDALVILQDGEWHPGPETGISGGLMFALARATGGLMESRKKGPAYHREYRIKKGA